MYKCAYVYVLVQSDHIQSTCFHQGPVSSLRGLSSLCWAEALVGAFFVLIYNPVSGESYKGSVGLSHPRCVPQLSEFDHFDHFEKGELLVKALFRVCVISATFLKLRLCLLLASCRV